MAQAKWSTMKNIVNMILNIEKEHKLSFVKNYDLLKVILIY